MNKTISLPCRMKRFGVIVLIQLYMYHLEGFDVFDEAIAPPKFVSVKTSVGKIVGKVENVQFDGRNYIVKVFLGIPYAEAPVGNKRLMKPVPKAPFKSPYAAYQYGAACLQRSDGVVGKYIPMSEDCLFLNIFVPEISGSSLSKLPVMIWIHGGAFVGGTSQYYPGETLSAFGEVIVVTINYRLAHLGFLRTNEGETNFGLWDQHTAIKWVNENIGSFGGDVNNITIFGESAGSSSVVYQSLFPGNKGLFHRVIAESGSITSPWAYSTDKHTVGIFLNFTEETGCTGKHEAKMMCLRSKSTDEIALVMNSPTLTFNDVVPSLDNAFVPKNPRDIIPQTTNVSESPDVFHDVDFMMGSCSIDAAYLLLYIGMQLNITDLDSFKVSRSFYESEIIPGVLLDTFSNIQNITEAANHVTIHEYTDWANPNDDRERTNMLIKLLTDAAMLTPVVSIANFHAGQRTHKDKYDLRDVGRTYLYEFSISPTSHFLPIPSWLNGPTKASHVDDVFFVFGFSKNMMNIINLYSDTYQPIRVTPEEISASKVVMTLWTNFAKTG